MDANLPRAARSEIGDERRADVRATTAAVFKQEQSNFTNPQEIGSVDDRAALTFSNDQTRAGENGEMRRHGVLRHSHEPGQFPGGDAFGFFLDEQPEGVEPRRLRERREGGNGFHTIHISSITDIYDDCNTLCRNQLRRSYSRVRGDAARTRTAPGRWGT